MTVALSRKIALLQYLIEHAPVPLRSLAESFKCPPRELHATLLSLFTTEITDGDGFIAPINLEFELDYDPDDVVDISLEVEPGSISLSYSEVLALLVVIDSQLKVATDTDRIALLRVRDLISQSISQHSRFSQLWPAPETVYAHELVAVLKDAITRRQMLQFNYWKPIENPEPSVESAEVQCFPLTVVAGHTEFLEASLADGQIRRYRLDRISEVKQLSQVQTTRENARLKAQAKRETPDFQGTRVKLLCAPEALWISEVTPQVSVVSQQAGEIVLEFTVRSRQVLRGILVRLGELVKGIEIAEDEGFAAALAQDFKKLLAHYQLSSESEA